MDQTRHAWLFQYSQESRQPSRGRLVRESWQISRWADELKLGDLVYIWHAGVGLIGWGEIAGRPTRLRNRGWRVAVSAKNWFTQPIAEERLFGSDAISRRNLLRRFPTNSIFRIEAAEAASIQKHIGDELRPEIDNLSDHKRSARHDWLTDVYGRLQIDEATPLVDRWLEYAVSLSSVPDRRPLVTSTTLFIAAFALGPIPSRDAVNSNEASGLQALAESAVVEPKIETSLRDLRAQYEISERSIPGGNITRNVERILRRASELMEIAPGDPNRLNANALLAALLLSDSSALKTHLEESDCSLETVRDATLSILAERDSKQIGSWRDALASYVDAANQIAPLTNDDPWARALSDKLGVDPEAWAIARLAAWKQFEPPFALGVFGDWGAGKTFFLRRIHNAIETLKRDASGTTTSPFLKEVVQIRFNAWHYSETNLWASLVDHIFSELDRALRAGPDEGEAQLIEKLTTAREIVLDAAETLVEQRGKQRKAAEHLVQLRHELERARAEARPTVEDFWTGVQALYEDDFAAVKTELTTVTRELGLDGVAKSARLLDDELGELKTSSGRTRLWMSAMLTRGTNAGYLLAAAVLVIVIPFVLTWLRDNLADWVHNPRLHDANVGVMSIGTALIGFLGLLSHAARAVRSSMQRLQSFGDRLAVCLAKQTRRQEEQVEQAEQAQAEQLGAIKDAEASLAIANNKIAEATQAYVNGSGQGRLLRFVRDRNGQATYAQHLSLIATVRRDFEELAAILTKDIDVEIDVTKQRQAAHQKRCRELIKAAGPLLNDAEKKDLEEAVSAPSVPQSPSIRRIILYIDDLDRCPPDKVAAVLQAVHLLLTFPLFVVIVAVDARWVGRALERHFSTLLDSLDSGETRKAATAQDYMEKIFQLPYWMRPMQGTASSDFLADRMGPIEAVPAVEVRLEPDVSAPRELESNLTRQQPGAESDVGPVSTPEAQSTEPVSFTAAEAAFITLLAPYAANSPRRGLRFLNAYRIVKASLDAQALGVLRHRGGYRALMFQLAIGTGCGSLEKPWFDYLSVSKTTDTDKFLAALAEKSWLSEQVPGSFSGLLDCLRHGALPGEDTNVVDRARSNLVEHLKLYEPIARRFSFTG